MTMLIYIVSAAAGGFFLGLALAGVVSAKRLAKARNDVFRLQARLDALADTRQELTDRFQLLASEILDVQSQKFTLQNREALSHLLSPLGEKITDFRQQIEAVHRADVAQRSALKQQVEMLANQSAQVGTKADRLADALKGDNKMLGNWGELSLQRLLEAAGLQNGRDYSLQVSLQDSDGRRQQPDAVVYLPEERCIIVDSKMSLKAYMEYTHAEHPDKRENALRRHIEAVEAHVKGLAKKNYHDLPDMQNHTPDFVLMFVPSEPALSLAVSNKPGLLEDAARANIILTGPGGLLSALRLSALLWRQANQNSAISEIFTSVRKIYDKYAGFSEDMQRIDEHLRKACDAYADAYKKLATGDGNLVRQMEKFRQENFIKPRKLPPKPYQAPDDAPGPGE
ncbi:MAG: DNA recombination protein RmuC [Verrucomicrobiota bacterium]|jgi:DNA recombination protein RmuC|nr:DNA recombination protein RmuC [Verrucomicrobiota bacterium]